MPSDRTLLTQAVAALLGPDTHHVVEASRVELPHDAYQAGRSLARLTGTAVVAGTTRPWSLVEKVTAGPAGAPPFIREGGRRELLAFRSGLLADLPTGFAAPRVLAIADAADETVTLLLEDVTDERPGAWTVDDYRIAAAALGRFSARGLSSPVAPEEWMLLRWSERHGQPDAIARAGPRMAEQSRESAVVARLGPSVGDRVASLLDGQAALRSRLDRLPHTLCHHDAVRANLFRRSRDGTDEVVAIDWETIGPGPIAADICSLVFSSVRRGDMPAALLPDVVPVVLAAYADELDAAGFAAAAADTEFGFLAAVSLRWSLLRDVMDGLVDSSYPVFRGRAMHEGRQVALDELLALTDFLLDAWAHVAPQVERG